eukprot:g36966.t1
MGDHRISEGRIERWLEKNIENFNLFAIVLILISQPSASDPSLPSGHWQLSEQWQLFIKQCLRNFENAVSASSEYLESWNR